VPARRCVPHFVLRTCSLAVLIGGLLLGPRAAAADAPAVGRPDSLTAAAVAFHLRYDAPPPSAPERDRWLGRDKARHVVFSGLWTLSAQYVLVRKADWTTGDALPASIATAAAVGIAKEGYDAARPAGTASGKDLVADAVGIGLAVGLILL